jgi:iron complex outermembrane receptor protein
MNRKCLSSMIVAALCMGSGIAAAQTQAADEPGSAQQGAKQASRASTSNTTTFNDTKRVQQMQGVQVSADSLSVGGGLMSVQTAPKAVSTITREAIVKASPGSNFTQMIASIPGVDASTDDVTGLANGNYSLRGFDSSEVGMTLNGAPITDTGSYSVYATEYGDSENMGDITVLQGTPDVDMPDSGAAGGHIGWATIDPSHTPGLDITQSFGSHDYRRTFLRANTGDTGPVRSWISYSTNTADKWRGKGDFDVTKVDGKSVWTIDDSNSVSASLQYNRESNYSYRSLTKAQREQYGYHYDYTESYTPGSTDTNFWKLHTNPFKSWLFSLDGEFKLSDDLRLSVIPYFWYGSGGGGSGNNYFQESPSTSNAYEYANQDLNGDGVVTKGSKALAYAYSAARTYRPGVIATFNQDFGMDDSLEYGFWYERSRKSQEQNFGLVDMDNGTPADVWGDRDYILYPDGEKQRSYLEYTTTTIEKGFVTNTWTPNDAWTLETGVSYLHAKRTGFVYEYPGSETGSAKYQQFGDSDTAGTWNKVLPSLGVKFQLDEHNQFFYGVGKTFRVPINTAVFLNTITGSGANKPETAWNNDLGWRYYDDRFSMAAMLYRSNFNNKTESAYDEDTGLTYYTQLKRLRMQGVNAEASFKFSPRWSVYASYTYAQSKLRTDLDAGGNGIYPTRGNYLVNSPRNLANLSLNYDDGHLWGGLSAHYAGARYGDYMNTEKVGGYTTLSFNAGYNFDDLGWVKHPYLKFNVANLTNRKALINTGGQLMASNPNKEKDVNGTTLYASSPTYTLLEPRTFMITLGASFF